jgi:hypothetical protein
MTHGRVSRAELRWVLLASLALMLLTSLPTLYAWSRADADHVFTGFVYNTEDGNSYIAKMRLGARGEWLFRLPFTTEEHRGAWLYTFHLLLGKLAAGLGISLQLMYHLARVVLGLGLLLTVYVFVARFVPDLATRRLAWVLIAVGSGMGWLLILLGAPHWLGNLPLDFWVPEAYVFLVIYSLPHLALAEMALLWALLFILDALAGDRVWHVLLAGVSALVMTIVVPFYPIVLAAIMGMYLLLLMVRERRIPWREIGLSTLMGLFTLPVVLYTVWVTSSDPVYGTWARQLEIMSPHPAHYLLGYLPLLLPAVWGFNAFIAQWKQSEGTAIYGQPGLLPIAWLAVGPLLAYAPFVSQRRLVVLIQVPLAILAALGLQIWFRARRSAIVAYVGVSSLSIVLLLAGSIGPIRQQSAPIYQPGAEVAALDWLSAHSRPGEAVFATFGVGNVIPAQTDLIAFAGHGPETIHATEKRTVIERFFQAETSDIWRESVLSDYQIAFLFYGPQEHALGVWQPESAPYLACIYAKNGYEIFRVTGP